MTVVDIKKIAEVQGRNGEQFELKVRWPWTVGNNEDTVWLDTPPFNKPTFGANNVIVSRKSVKKNKEGQQYDGTLDWMWNWTIVEFGVDGELPPNPASATSNGQQSQPLAEEQQETRTPPPAQVNASAIGACANHAVDAILRGHQPVPEGRTLNSWIREVRDGMYWEVNQVLPCPPHWCYVHEESRKEGKGAWGHRIEGGWCMEKRGIVLDQAPVVTESRTQPPEQPEEPESQEDLSF